MTDETPERAPQEAPKTVPMVVMPPELRDQLVGLLMDKLTMREAEPAVAMLRSLQTVPIGIREDPA